MVTAFVQVYGKTASQTNRFFSSLAEKKMNETNEQMYMKEFDDMDISDGD